MALDPLEKLPALRLMQIKYSKLAETTFISCDDAYDPNAAHEHFFLFTKLLTLQTTITLI